MKPLLEARRIIQTYNSKPALNLPYFSLAEGEIIILKGPNGSGKSTLLRILAFLEKPAQGEIHFYGALEPRRRITLLLQEPWLMRESVYKNVTLGLRIRGETANLQSAYLKAMQMAGFEDGNSFRNRRPHELSGGEKQRIALAARLILNPLLLLLDEPTAYVDGESARIIVNSLGKLSVEGMAIVCATHDPELVAALHGTVLELPA